jgi:hypothetical protein
MKKNKHDKARPWTQGKEFRETAMATELAEEI